MMSASSQTQRVAVQGEVLLRQRYIEGLSSDPRDLSRHPEILYDARGVELLNVIRRLHSYYIPSLEAVVLEGCAKNIVQLCKDKGISWLADLGAGKSPRTPILFNAMDKEHLFMDVHLCDISTEANSTNRERLRQWYVFPWTFTAHLWGCDAVLQWLPQQRKFNGRGILSFLGQNFGNFWPSDEGVAFLRRVYEGLSVGGLLLLGLDCPPHDQFKPAYEVLQAYRGPDTDNFIRNALHRLVALGGTVDLTAWHYFCDYDFAQDCVIMGLQAISPNEIRVENQRFSFEAGEDLIVERSYRYSPGRLIDLAAAAGFNPDKIKIFQDVNKRYLIACLER